MPTETREQATVFIPTPLRSFTENRPSVTAAGSTAAEVLNDLVSRYPSLKPHLYDEQERLRSFVNVYVNDDDIRYLQNGDTRVSAGDSLSIVPSIAGG